MTLVNLGQHATLAMLTKDLLNSLVNDTFVNVHIQSDMIEMSHCIVPDDVIIGDDIMIVKGNLQLTIKVKKSDEFNITYDEIENGYCIHCDNTYFYIDFN